MTTTKVYESYPKALEALRANHSTFVLFKCFWYDDNEESVCILLENGTVKGV